jgi:integrase/recombinase XerD
VLQKSVNQLGLGHGSSAHAMRSTFISTVLENGAKLEDVQRMVGHADPSTTQLYDRQRFMAERSVALVVVYRSLASGNPGQFRRAGLGRCNIHRPGLHVLS